MTDNMIIFCDKCEFMIGVEMYVVHDKICVTKIKNDDNKIIMKSSKSSTSNKKFKKQSTVLTKEITNINTIIDLLPHQLEAIRWCSLKAQIYHKNVYPNAVIRFMELGYSEDDVVNCLEYIKNIDVIAHFGRNATGPIEWLKTETKMKNTFEIHPENAGYINPRKDWENNMFNKIYSSDCDVTSRVKYGCLNLMADPIGCYSATGYGMSHMIFKPDVKCRSTFVCGDSSSKQMHICTFDKCVQLLLYMDTNTLTNVIHLAKMKKTKQYDVNKLEYQNIQRSYVYIEMQIHDDIVFSKDIAHIMLYYKHYDDDILNRLDKLGVPYTIFDDNDTKVYKPLFVI